MHLISDGETRRRLESSARQLVVEKYDWGAVARDLEDALTTVRGGHTPDVRVTA